MRITASDFFGGFFAALAFKQPGRVFRCGEKFNEALKDAFDAFVQRSKSSGVEPNFLIRLDPLHGDSCGIDEGLVGAMRRDFISLDNPSFEKFRLKIDKNEAEQILPEIPGGKDSYQKLVDDFLKGYYSTLATH